MSFPSQTFLSYSKQVPNQTFKCSARISAAYVFTKVTGETTAGAPTQVEPGTMLEICGAGYNQRTVKVRSAYDILYVFRQDLVDLTATESSSECMDDLPKFSDSHGETQSDRIECLRADLAFCFELADLVDTVQGLDDTNAALRVKAIAEAAHDTIARFLPNVDDGVDKDALHRQFSALRLRLDSLQIHTIQVP